MHLYCHGHAEIMVSWILFHFAALFAGMAKYFTYVLDVSIIQKYRLNPELAPTRSASGISITEMPACSCKAFGLAEK
jgi:hypothetical protein